MFSLQRLFGKEDRFFDLLELSAEEARRSVQALIEMTKAPDQPKSLEAFAESRRKNKRITSEITELLCTSFVTALEREDIEALSIALYKIPKTVEKIGERIRIAVHHLKDVNFSEQVRLLSQATDTILAMIKELRQGMSLERVRAQNEKLQNIEGDADKLILSLYEELYNGPHEALRVIVLKDIYELLEKVIDRCRDAGNVVSHIVMKNS